MALDDQTPAEKAGIQVGGKDKWLTIIQNATLTKETVKRDQIRFT